MITIRVTVTDEKAQFVNVRAFSELEVATMLDRKRVFGAVTDELLREIEQEKAAARG